MRHAKKKQKVSADEDDSRDWSALPDLPLSVILGCLLTVFDLLAFSGVCRSWRSLFRSAAADGHLVDRPPLLLCPHAGTVQHVPGRLVLKNPLKGKSRPCSVPPDTLARPCVGYSYGNLIFFIRGRLLIVDVFTGREVRVPELPGTAQGVGKGRCFLTSPLSSPRCRLILSCQSHPFLTCRVRGGGCKEWVGRRPDGTMIVFPIQQVISIKGEIYAVDYTGKIFTIRFTPRLNMELMMPGVLDFDDEPAPFTTFGQQLVECGGELLLVRCTIPEPDLAEVVIYKLEKSTATWTKVEDLGDWSLFIDAVGRYSVSCINPSRWGGLSNCAYVVGPKHPHCYCIYQLNQRFVCFYWNSPLCPKDSSGQDWPSPLWVHPSFLF